MMENQRLLVVGAGQMGAGIAQTAATQGFEVWLTDNAPEQVQKALSGMQARLSRAVETGKLTADQQRDILSRIHAVPTAQSVSSIDLCIEAIVEAEAVKVGVFRELGEHFGPDTILASNTSSISISRIARDTRYPERVIGMHFMNPVPVMRLVEVVEGALTKSEVTQHVMAAAEAMGKVPVLVQDYPGFVSNRILMPMINEAIFALQEGVASREAIDTVMKLGMNHPMGPLTLADFIGLDTCLSIMEVLYQGFSDSKYRPAPLLRKMVDAGLLGRKSGQGFYHYDK